MATNLSDLMDLAEGDRRALGGMRLGQVCETDPEKSQVRVKLADGQISGWLPVGSWGAGGFSVWAMPGVGEQVTVMAPSGDIESGIIGPRLYQDQYPAPSTDPNETLLAWDDGGSISYRRDTHKLLLTAPCGVWIDGDLIVSGDVMAAGGNPSLIRHTHDDGGPAEGEGALPCGG